MGIDLLDIQFRVEKRFAIRLDQDDFNTLFGRRQPPGDATAGDLAALVLAKLVGPGKPPTPPTEYLDRQIPCATCGRGLPDLPRTAYCPRCGTSATASQVLVGVRRVLEAALGVPYDEIRPDSLLVRDLGMG
jgi:hypothetical protein